jgi:pimeloyl-ACP methyl ester carboxylesterase
MSPVILVHGAWHGAWCFSDLQCHLDRHGVASYALDLPGHGTSTEPPTDLFGDADHVATVIESIAARHRQRVVLVGHSYGGAVISDALRPGVMDSVSAVVVVAGFALNVGEAVSDIARAHRVDGLALSAAIVAGDDGTSTLDPDLAGPALFNTTDPTITAASIARLEPQIMANFTQRARHSPFDVPTSANRPHRVYIRCLRDQAVPVIQQDVMAERCDQVITFDVDHCPHMSATTELAEALAHLARHGG